MLICWHSLFWLATISFVFCLHTSISVTSHTRVSAGLIIPHYSLDHLTCKTCLTVLSSFLDFYGYTFSWLCSFFLDSSFVLLWLCPFLWHVIFHVYVDAELFLLWTFYSLPSFVSGLSRLTLTISYWLILFFLWHFNHMFTLETFITCHNTPH